MFAKTHKAYSSVFGGSLRFFLVANLNEIQALTACSPLIGSQENKVSRHNIIHKSSVFAIRL